MGCAMQKRIIGLAVNPSVYFLALWPANCFLSAFFRSIKIRLLYGMHSIP